MWFYDNSIANYPEESQYPEAWVGLAAAWVPSLGPYGGSMLRDLSGSGEHLTMSSGIYPALWRMEIEHPIMSFSAGSQYGVSINRGGMLRVGNNWSRIMATSGLSIVMTYRRTSSTTSSQPLMSAIGASGSNYSGFTLATEGNNVIFCAPLNTASYSTSADNIEVTVVGAYGVWCTIIARCWPGTGASRQNVALDWYGINRIHRTATDSNNKLAGVRWNYATVSPIYLGRWGTTYYTGYLASALVYNRDIGPGLSKKFGDFFMDEVSPAVLPFVKRKKPYGLSIR